MPPLLRGVRAASAALDVTGSEVVTIAAVTAGSEIYEISRESGGAILLQVTDSFAHGRTQQKCHHEYVIKHKTPCVCMTHLVQRVSAPCQHQVKARSAERLLQSSYISPVSTLWREHKHQTTYPETRSKRPRNVAGGSLPWGAMGVGRASHRRQYFCHCRGRPQYSDMEHFVGSNAAQGLRRWPV